MDIAIIGAGPRGLVELQRLVEWQKREKKFANLKITLLDPYGIGGRVWQIDQPHDLLMNTNPNNVTLFPDDSDEIDGPVVTGPDMYDWTRTEAREFIDSHSFKNNQLFLDEIDQLKPNGFASRSLYGVYVDWFYRNLQRDLGDAVTVQLVKEEVQSVSPQNDQFIVVTSGQTLVTDKVIMSLGHYEDELTPDQQRFSDIARANDLTYVTPTHPQEYDFSDLQGHQTVIMRGMGLNFFDAITLLTRGRGGKYSRGADGMLEYHVSGEEPKIVAGSRRGFPLRAKGIYNTAEKDFQGHYITKEWLDSFDKSGSMSGKELLERVRCEMEYAYYDVLLQEKYPKINREILLADVVNSKTPKAVIEQSAIKPADRFVFREELRPEVKYRNSNRQDVMLDYLTYDVQTAQKGTKTGPIAAALEVLRAIRNDIREIVDRRLLSGGDYYNYVLGEFKREDSYLAVGPPDQRIEELRALVKAGVVTILGPEMAVDFDEESKQFETWSKTYPEEKYLADYLVEARLPSINANTSKNPLIRSLFDQGLAESQKVDVDGDSKETGSVSIDVIHETLTPSAVQDTGLFFWGVPTEGEHWFTTTSPHPGLPDTVIKGADRIAAQIFEFPFDKNK